MVEARSSAVAPSRLIVEIFLRFPSASWKAAEVAAVTAVNAAQ
jgi:hypothetical protein